MVREYQETANFMYGAHNGDELKRMAASQLPCFPPQKFFVKRALVLSETDYHFFVHDDFRNPPYALKALRQGPDPGLQRTQRLREVRALRLKVRAAMSAL